MSININSLFSSNRDPFISMINMCPVLSTPVDWKETSEAHVFMADLPGLTKEDVKVEVLDDGVLQISGEWKDDSKKDDTWRHVERCRGKFCRRFRLPGNAKTDEVKASMENGVLTVTAAKQELKKPEKKVIQIEEAKA